MQPKSHDTKHKTTIGGQALIEGVMMRGPKKSAMAVRTPDGTIVREDVKFNSLTKKVKFLKWPFFRGIIMFGESLVLGYRTLMRSATLAGEEEITEPGKTEQWIAKKTKINVLSIMLFLSALIGIGLSVALFMFLPAFTSSLIERHLWPAMGETGWAKTLVEGLIRITIFVCYLGLVSMMKDIRRVFEYHGAEHQTIYCYEEGMDLTVENVKKFSSYHPRCGTSFLFIVMIVSIFVFMLIPPGVHMLVRIGYQLCLLPFVAGTTYEINRAVGRHCNWFTRMISAPGMALQRFTTRTPDDAQIEVAIAALEEVLDFDSGEDKW